MNPDPSPSLYRSIKTLLIGGSRSPFDHSVFHHLSLIAFFAWVGLGADGLSSSSYGPQEAFLALHHVDPATGSVSFFPHLSIFVALGTTITVLVISASYSQIIELFPTGGGGYLVASKLLSPVAGMVSGSALLLDYVLTIALSIAVGANTLFSFLPESAHALGVPLLTLKLPFMVGVLGVLTVMNLRGVKESVVPLVPIFVVFVITHFAIIATTVVLRFSNFHMVYDGTVADVRQASNALGVGGMIFLVLKAYSMGAGTYTGIEAVSNGLPILREPREVTGKRTMRYMAISLAVTAVGLMLAYLLYDVGDGLVRDHQWTTQYGQVHDEKTTLNAVLCRAFIGSWPSPWGSIFIWVTLVSEAAILFVAAQAGFLDGPRVLSNMAVDSWVPHRFATLSDRLVTQNGVVVMSLAAVGVLLLSGGSVTFLVVLYAINVFITFTLSQTGMVRHWWSSRHTEPHWHKGLLLNGAGLILCVFILVTTISLKLGEGGWLTVFMTASLALVCWLIRRHYDHTKKLLRRLDTLVRVAETLPPKPAAPKPLVRGAAATPGALGPSDDTADADATGNDDVPAPAIPFDANAKTAVLLVNGFNGLGLHTLFSIVRLFGGVFRNFVIVQVGVVDVGNFKGVSEVGHLKEHVAGEVQRYINYLQREGYYVEAFTGVGIDVVDEIAKLAPQILDRFPQAVFFGGQLVFPRESFLTRWLHNNTVFSLQRRFYNQGIPVVVLPIRV